MSVGIIGKSAPELRVSFWIDETGARREPLKLADLGPGYKVLYCFQDWCPGCHSRGFPTLKRLVEQLSGTRWKSSASTRRLTICVSRSVTTLRRREGDTRQSWRIIALQEHPGSSSSILQVRSLTMTFSSIRVALLPL